MKNSQKESKGGFEHTKESETLKTSQLSNLSDKEKRMQGSEQNLRALWDELTNVRTVGTQKKREESGRERIFE